MLCRSLQEPVASVELYEYLDNCIQQLVKKSVKYYEQFNSLATERGLSLEKPKRHDVDLLFVAIADQWPFLFKEPSPAKIALITTWVVSYLDLSMQAGRDHEFLILVRDMIVQSTQDTAGRSALEQALQVSSLVASDKPISRDGNKDQAVVTTSSGYVFSNLQSALLYCFTNTRDALLRDLCPSMEMLIRKSSLGTCFVMYNFLLCCFLGHET